MADFCDGISRRGVLQAGLAGTLGLSLPELLRLQAQAGETPGRSETAVIYLEMAGGPAQHETYDPKPLAPREYRGPFSAVDTSVPGVQLCELMAEQARSMDKLAVIRSVHHDSGSHGTSSHLTQTGYYLRDRQNRENEMPCVGAVTGRLRGPNADGVPSYVAVPGSMRYGGAAWLGKGHNPFTTGRDANRDNFKVPNLSLLKGVPESRLQDRQRLLAEFDASRRILDNRGIAEATDQFTQKAFEMVAGDGARKAFDIGAEDPKIRDRYGRNRIGQNVLLARRLVEHGVTFVTVRANRLGSWDDHRQIVKRMNRKGPAFDRAVAALVDDLHDRGLARKTLVVCMGEFGRTPKINNRGPEPGRDHWGRVMSVALAGGGLRTGQVVGSSDSKGAVPHSSPYRPESVLTMVYRHLGIDPSTTIVDNSGRPRYLLEHREPIHELI